MAHERPPAKPVRAIPSPTDLGSDTGDPVVISWVDRCAAGVSLSRKGAKSQGRKLRLTGTKAKDVARSDEQAALVKKLKAHVGDLEKKLEARTRELGEARNHLAKALEQQTATSEVLGVISSSPGELVPIFEAILANATRLCEAKFGNLALVEGDRFRICALHGAPPAYAEWWRRNPWSGPARHPVLPVRLIRSRRFMLPT